MRKLQTFWLAVAVSFALGIVLCLLPLVSVHGVDSALVLGIVVPPFVAAFAASYARAHADSQTGLELQLNAMGGALLILAAPVVLLAANALRVRQCAPWEGLAFIGLGPAIGVVVTAAFGVFCAITLRGVAWSPWAAVLATLASLAFGVFTFWNTPAVYVFGLFAGYFPGTLYDTSVTIGRPYLTFRACSAAVVLACVLLTDAIWDRPTKQVGWRAAALDKPGRFAIGFAALCVVVGVYSQGATFRHRSSVDLITERLGKSQSSEHCVLHVPRELHADAVQRLLEDCDFHVTRTAKFLDLSMRGPVVAYFFRNGAEKRRLMGAGKTLVAKPWRNEVYLQLAEWPHPVFGHEIAHVVAANAARAPFRVSATWGGWLPNPGLIEGTAVAAAWDIRDNIDPDRWSKIMLDRGELPSASTLMSLAFSSLPARKAYAAAGSLVNQLIAQRGLRGWHEAYNSGHIDDLQALEAQWHAHLNDNVNATEKDRAIAAVALGHKGIFGSVCPRKVATLRAHLQQDLAARDDTRAAETCAEILDIDPAQAGARAAHVGVLARTNQHELADMEIDTLRTVHKAPEPVIAQALERVADAAWQAGDLKKAAGLYDEILAMPQTDDQARGREVKKLALAGTKPEQQLVQALLLEPANGIVAVHVARELAKVRKDGLGAYLEARQLLGQRRFDLALALLDEADKKTLPTERLRTENLRLLGTARFAAGDFVGSAAAWNEYAKSGQTAATVAKRWHSRIAATKQ